jgi:hypothetical protein
MQDDKDQTGLVLVLCFSTAASASFVIIIKTGESADFRWDRVLARITNVCAILTFLLALALAIRG